MRTFRLSSRLIGLSALLALLLGAFNNCVKTPSVDAQLASSEYIHTGQEVSCAGCHETDRPTPVNSIIHGDGADCVACHGVPGSNGSATTGSVSAMWIATNLGPYTHATAGITTCLNCHSGNNPGPVNGFAHYNNNDCVMCHNPDGNNTDGLTLTQIDADWAAAGAYNYIHPFGLTSCASCHEKDRPAPISGVPHGGGADCVSCHGTSDSWSSSLTRTQIDYLWLSTEGQQGN